MLGRPAGCKCLEGQARIPQLGDAGTGQFGYKEGAWSLRSDRLPAAGTGSTRPRRPP